LGLNDTALLVDEDVLKRDREFQDMSVDAVVDLKAMSRREIVEKQKEYLKRIEPEEKVKIKKKEKLLKKSTEEITEDLLRDEIALEDIASARGLKQETIVSHIEDLIAKKGESAPDIAYLRREFKRNELDDIHAAFEKAKTLTLAPVYTILSRQKKNPSYLKIRLARLFLQNES